MPKTKRMIAFTDPQLAFLDREAARLDISVPEVLRRILDEFREAREHPPTRRHRLEPAVTDELERYETEIGDISVAAVQTGGDALLDEVRDDLRTAQLVIERARRGDPMLTPGFGDEIQRLLERARRRIFDRTTTTGA